MEIIGNDNINEVSNKLLLLLPQYKYFQYRNYPANNSKCWQDYYLYKLEQIPDLKDTYCYFDFYNNEPYIINFCVKEWDKELFGFYLASASIIYTPYKINSDFFKNFLNNCLRSLVSQKNVKFVSVRINGDNLEVIHIFEELGFHYYEDVIWPVLYVSDESKYESDDVRLMNQYDLEEVEDVARNYQYQRGHFHSDKNFDLDKVNELYAKWIRTYFYNQNPITIIKYNNKIVGYFVLMKDEILSKYFGKIYFRMRSLALNGEVRGKGLGLKIFKRSISIMRDMGAEIIDSGYSTKNHLSAKLHNKTGFNSVYEEITLHKWY